MRRVEYAASQAHGVAQTGAIHTSSGITTAAQLVPRKAGMSAGELCTVLTWDLSALAIFGMCGVAQGRMSPDRHLCFESLIIPKM